MENVSSTLQPYTFRIACDDRCRLVRNMATVIKWWDVHHKFVFIKRDSLDAGDQLLLDQLDASKYSIILFDDNDVRWDGPESIPMILKNLPAGKLAAVFYILPGTMWLTKQVYMLVSRNKQHFIQRQSAT